MIEILKEKNEILLTEKKEFKKRSNFYRSEFLETWNGEDI